MVIFHCYVSSPEGSHNNPSATWSFQIARDPWLSANSGPQRSKTNPRFLLGPRCHGVLAEMSEVVSRWRVSLGCCSNPTFQQPLMKPRRKLPELLEFGQFQLIRLECTSCCPHGSLVMSPLNITQPWSVYGLFNGYYKVMSNIPKMGQLPTPVSSRLLVSSFTKPDSATCVLQINWCLILRHVLPHNKNLAAGNTASRLGLVMGWCYPPEIQALNRLPKISNGTWGIWKVVFFLLDIGGIVRSSI